MILTSRTWLNFILAILLSITTAFSEQGKESAKDKDKDKVYKLLKLSAKKKQSLAKIRRLKYTN